MKLDNPIRLLLAFAARKSLGADRASLRWWRVLWDLATAVCFIGLLATPLTLMLLNSDQRFDPILEGRAAAPAPKWKLPEEQRSLRRRLSDGFRSYCAQTESYLADHLAFRDEALDAYHRSRLRGLTTSSLEMPTTSRAADSHVGFGKEGWLFYCGHRSIEGYRHNRPLTIAELERHRAQMQRNADLLRSCGIEYRVLIAPDKGTIYPEYLPDFIRSSGGPSRLDQLLEYMANHSDVRFVDVRPALLEAKKTRQIYFKTDTHWNDLGGQIACRLLLESLGHPNAAREVWSAYDIREGQLETDERRMLRRVVPSEIYWRLEPHQPRTAISHWGDGTAYKTINEAVPIGKCLVIHDSFFELVAPFFSEHFHEVRYRRGRDVRDSDLANWTPDVVIESFVERILNLNVLE